MFCCFAFSLFLKTEVSAACKLSVVGEFSQPTVSSTVVIHVQPEDVVISLTRQELCSLLKSFIRMWPG